MNEKKKLKIILLGLVILMNIGVMVVVLSDSKEDNISKFKNEIESKLLESSSTNEEKLVQVVRDNEDIGSDSSNNIESSINNLNNLNNINDEKSESSENSINSLNNISNEKSESSENNINNLNNISNENSESSENSSNNLDKNSSNISLNNVYQDTVSQPEKDYLNGTESTAYIQEKLDEKYTENGGIYLMDGAMIAYGLDGSLKTKEGHTIFYWGYFLNDEKPPYNGLHVTNELYRVVTLDSVTREITDFGYKNGRKYEELGFRTGPKR